MNTLYCLAMKSGDKYEERSVHPTFNSALVSFFTISLIIYPMVKFVYCIYTEITNE